MRTWGFPLVYLSSLFVAKVFADSTTCHDTDEVKITFYGYPDNSPPGPGIRCALDSRQDCSGCAGNSSRTQTAGECGPRGETAGGTGTYDDPITMASAATWFCHQEVVYLPYLRKYLRYEDYCADCTGNATVGILHIDIWTGSTTTNGGALQDKCEKLLTPDERQPMIRSPPNNLPVDREYIASFCLKRADHLQSPSYSNQARSTRHFVMERRLQVEARS